MAQKSFLGGRQVVEIRSELPKILAVVHADDTLRPFERGHKRVVKVKKPIQHPMLGIKEVVIRLAIAHPASDHAVGAGGGRRERGGARRQRSVRAQQRVGSGRNVRWHERAIKLRRRRRGLVGRVGIRRLLSICRDPVSRGSGVRRKNVPPWRF